MSSVTPSKMSLSREASGARGEVRITPHSTRRIAPCGTIPFCRGAPSAPFATRRAGSSFALTTPYPVIAVPGSIPRTITGRVFARACGSRLSHRRKIHVEVRVHFLHVVEFLQRLDELEQRLGVRAFHAHRAPGKPRELGGI